MLVGFDSLFVLLALHAILLPRCVQSIVRYPMISAQYWSMAASEPDIRRAEKAICEDDKDDSHILFFGIEDNKRRKREPCR